MAVVVVKVARGILGDVVLGEAGGVHSPRLQSRSRCAADWPRR